MSIITRSYAKELISKAWNRKADSVKGDAGRVLIIGGSEQYVGCLALSGIAVFRAGADWVSVAAPERVAWSLNSFPDLVTRKLEGSDLKNFHVSELQEMIDKHDVLLIGQGMTSASSGIIRRLVVSNPRTPKVLDAQAIYSVKVDEASNALFTPNLKEFRSISARINKNVVLRKGVVDEVISKDKIFRNKTGNSGMTKAGTGDVLAGLCAGFLAQGLSLEEAACLAAYMNGKAGDVLHKRVGCAYLASDILDALCGVLS